MAIVKIGFAGDFCPMGRIETAFKQGAWKELIKDAEGFFNKNDFNVIDLECPLTNEIKGIVKTGPHIKSIPETAEILNALNCDVVVTANNHFKDYGWEGMQETYKALKDKQINWLGSGSNLNEASKIYIRDCNGIKIALINMTENEWTTTHGNEAGCNPIDFPQALNSIQEAKAKEVDFIIVVLHGGHENYPLPSPRMKNQFRFMIDAGADAVIGHHTHIISGYEIYKNKPIFYSLGNFCFDWPALRNGTWNKGMLVSIIMNEDRSIGFEYEFIIQNDDQVGVRLMDLEEKIYMEAEVQRLNSIILDDFALLENFNTYCETVKSTMLLRLQPYSNKFLLALNKRGILPNILGFRKKNMIRNLAQCESHREVLVEILKYRF